LLSSASAFAVVPGVMAVTVTVELESVPVTSGSTAQAPLAQVPAIALFKFPASVAVLLKSPIATHL
jgi:hypothetical protein